MMIFIEYNYNHPMSMHSILLDLMQPYYSKKENKMTREETILKLRTELPYRDSSVLNPTLLVKSLEALGLIKFDELSEKDKLIHEIDKYTIQGKYFVNEDLSNMVALLKKVRKFLEDKKDDLDSPKFDHEIYFPFAIRSGPHGVRVKFNDVIEILKRDGYKIINLKALDK